ncbi:conserved Plasmodium protein, unknown function [Plasmodium knowlesi strain H]|uniref:Uncharacterized protein n=3 Tax=Plasmodium knowlesi TaxID=5850 RepID=A0A5K1UE48_PLAKH|nr:conserved Plasmodium protein, unknown function [Plasmodium knowlesi strain H]OTN67165.1 Uncharacterized protein PKNOH_S07458800 [Plasmodium knowlesi]CAA9988713.1 conserved Plasmodium protein, unknown function [Plasmodium knowlesi strain H]SBO21662.1 conserved Plasmodium protein, unknown function [Plasmodium knowlesi strain H]SBO22016.1 conserved Plasmodium protein, unknown function [Plasmodium knowlesi strain H]VVS78187.1 conserved Plasmodium protein, unknown function [Plasmodium knowlesi s|eukprot:XP_002259690.1 hypothetical protein, conserved in Plasmodium species [Plasmodium knowlesi strain H]
MPFGEIRLSQAYPPHPQCKMDRLTYINEYAKIFHIGTDERRREEKHSGKKHDAECSEKEKHYSKVKGKNAPISSSNHAEERGVSRKLYPYRESKNEYPTQRVRKANEYHEFGREVSSSNLSLTSKDSKTVNHPYYEMKRRDTRKTLNYYLERVHICKRCYMNELHERKRRTAVYTLEFNNLADCEPVSGHHLVKRNTTLAHDLKHKSKYREERPAGEGNKGVIIVERRPEQIPQKKNLFQLLNSIFSVN